MSYNPFQPTSYFYQTGIRDRIDTIGREFYGVHDNEKLDWLREMYAESDLYSDGYFKPHRTLHLTAPRFAPAPPEMCRASAEYIRHMIQSMPPKEREAFMAAAWLQQNWNILNSFGGTALGLGSNVLNPRTVGPLKEIATAYERYQAGEITKGQYDYQRKLRLERFRALIGPTERIFFPGKTPSEVFRISRTKAIPATDNIIRNAGRLQTIARVASKGNVVLAVAGLGIACSQMAQAESRLKKNQIAVEATFGFAAGVGAGAIIGLVLAATPVGWVAALVLAGGAAAVSYAAGKGAVKLYDLLGNEFDLVKAARLDSLCS